jgi:hypothetical protein
MRGTVHITLAEDIGWLLDLTGVRALNQKSLERRWDNLGIDQTLLERAREVAVTLLRDGGRATRAWSGTWLRRERSFSGRFVGMTTSWSFLTTGCRRLGV